MRKRYGLPSQPHYHQGELFPVQSSVLDEAALLIYLQQHYQIPTSAECRFLTRGSADIYRIRSNEGNFYVKVYRPPQTESRTEAEALWVMALAEVEVPVVKVMLGGNGRYSHTIPAPEGNRPLLIFYEAPPPLPRPVTTTLLTHIGQAVAHLHNASDALNTHFNLPILEAPALVHLHLNDIYLFLPPAQQETLTHIAQQLTLNLDQLSQTQSDFGLCHADLVMSNMSLTVDNDITFLDFGNCGQTWRAWELAVVLWTLERSAPQEFTTLWTAFLQGYQQERTLSETMLATIPLMKTVRQISFLGGNCATLPLRLGTELFEGSFIEQEMKRLQEWALAGNII